MKTGSRVSVSDDVFFRKDGSRFPVRYEASPKRQDGRIVGVVVVFRDMSREERLESIAAAVETMNSLGFVFSAVRHELGNPVNSVKMALSVLRKNLDRFDAETVRDFVDRSLLELGRVEELLASLRTYSLYEDVQLRVLDLAGFVREFVDFVSRDFAARGVSVVAEPQDGPVFAAADPRALRHVLLNLVANAAEAMEAKGGSIRLGVLTEGEWAGIRVEDDGPGDVDGYPRQPLPALLHDEDEGHRPRPRDREEDDDEDGRDDRSRERSGSRDDDVAVASGRAASLSGMTGPARATLPRPPIGAPAWSEPDSAGPIIRRGQSPD